MISQGGKGGDLAQAFMNNQATQAAPLPPLSIAAPVTAPIAMPVPTGPRPYADPQQTGRSGMQQGKQSKNQDGGLGGAWEEMFLKNAPQQSGKKR